MLTETYPNPAFALADMRSQVDTLNANSALVPGGPFTVDTLPDPALWLDRYAVVTDLFGVKRDRVLASKVGSLSFWQPLRPVFKGPDMVLTADATLVPLKSPSVVTLAGTLITGLTRTVNLSTVNAFPGASFEIRNNMGGLGTLKIGNLLNLGSLLSLLTNANARFFYSPETGWQQFS